MQVYLYLSLVLVGVLKIPVEATDTHLHILFEHLIRGTITIAKIVLLLARLQGYRCHSPPVVTSDVASKVGPSQPAQTCPKKIGFSKQKLEADS